jgi:hypothetical protein
VTHSAVRRFAAVCAVLLVVDWALGVLCARGVLPLWVFLLANLPLGVLYVGLELTWTGTRYVVLGRTVGEMTSLAVFLGVVVGQSLLCFGLLQRLWTSRRPREHRAAGDVA